MPKLLWFEPHQNDCWTLGWLPVQNLCQIFLDTPKRYFLVCSQTGLQPVPPAEFSMSPSLPPPKELCFGWDYKYSNRGCCVPMLLTTILQGAQGVQASERRGKTIHTFYNFVPHSAPKCLKKHCLCPESHKVSWRGYWGHSTHLPAYLQT